MEVKSDLEGDALRRSLVAFVENLCDVIVKEARPKTEPVDPAEWGTAKANEVIAKLKGLAEQLYACCMFMQQAFGTTFEMNTETAAFLKFLGVPVTKVAKAAGLSRPTLYATVDAMYEKLRQQTGQSIYWRADKDGTA